MHDEGHRPPIAASYARRRLVEDCAFVLDADCLRVPLASENTSEAVLRVLIGQGDGRRTQAVKVVRTRPHFGGTRWLFACPRCGRRCRFLYLPVADASLACRRCHSLVYRSSRRSRKPSAVQRMLAAELGFPPTCARRLLREMFAGRSPTRAE